MKNVAWINPALEEDVFGRHSLQSLYGWDAGPLSISLSHTHTVYMGGRRFIWVCERDRERGGTWGTERDWKAERRLFSPNGNACPQHGHTTVTRRARNLLSLSRSLALVRYTKSETLLSELRTATPAAHARPFSHLHELTQSSWYKPCAIKSIRVCGWGACLSGGWPVYQPEIRARLGTTARFVQMGGMLAWRMASEWCLICSRRSAT